MACGIDDAQRRGSLEGVEKHSVQAVRARREGVPASRVAGHCLLDDTTDRDALPESSGLEGGLATGEACNGTHESDK